MGEKREKITQFSESVHVLAPSLKFFHLPVCAPAARLHLIGVKTPKFELFLEERSTHVGWVM